MNSPMTNITIHQSDDNRLSNVLPFAGANVRTDKIGTDPTITTTSSNSNRSNQAQTNIMPNIMNTVNNVINNANKARPTSTASVANNQSNNVNAQSPPVIINTRQHIQNDELSVLTGYYACSRYFLFMIYIILLVSLIMNTFLHFIFYGSNMSIASMFLDVHHRQELINGEYYSLESYVHDNYGNVHISTHHRQPQFGNIHRSEQQQFHCDRAAFLSLLDEFYHQYPKPPAYETPGERNNPNNRNPSNNKYPKIFNDFNNYARSKDRSSDGEDVGDDEMFYSSSSTSVEDQDQSRRLARAEKRHINMAKNNNENRLLIIEVIALILLFVTVLNQVLGLIAVIKKHLILLIFVTIVDSILFCILVFISNIGLIILLLLATSVGYLFIFQLKIGLRRRIKERQRLKEDISNEVQDAIVQMRNRMSPCIHVSMEQYEAMTQQMLHRYSSPIVYCPHYNESLC